MRKSSHVQYDLKYHLVWTTKLIKEYIENQQDEFEENFKIV